MDFETIESAENDNKTYQQLVEVLHSILPEKVDEAYVNLANSLQHFGNTVKKIEEITQVTENSAKKVSKAREDRDMAAQKKEDILAKLKGLLLEADAKTLNNSTWEQLARLSNEGLEQSKQNTRYTQKYESGSAYYEKNALEAMDIREELTIAAADLKKCMREVMDLSIDGERRIDRIQINKRHMKQINEMTVLTETDKTALKRIVHIYIKMRVEAFKKIEEISMQRLQNYQKRELDVSPLEKAEYAVVTNALTFSSYDLENMCVHLGSPMGPILIEKNLNAMMLTTDYLQGKEITSEQLQRVLEPEPDFTDFFTRNTLYMLENAMQHTSKVSIDVENKTM